MKKNQAIVNEENSARIEEISPEEGVLLERSNAPPLRDLRAAAKDLLAKITMDRDQNLSNSSSPRQ